MRIVWAAATFLAGVGCAIAFGIAPGQALPMPTFLLFGGTATVISIALIVSRRSAAVTLLCIVFLLGSWRGGDAIQVLEDSDRYPTASFRDPISSDSIVNRFRLDIADGISLLQGPVNTGLPAALLVGDRSGINSEVTLAFRSAGLAHLLAISGLHVSLLGGSAMALSVMVFGRRRALYLLFPLLTVLVYAALAGFAPPITRAAMMFTVFVLGRSMGRGSHTITALALAALVMVVYSPEILASLSFQLSFTAMLGIAFVAPVLDVSTEIKTSDDSRARRYSLTNRARKFVLGSLAISLASTIGTLPLIALHFDAVPIWGPVATLFALPAIPLIIFSSALFVLAGEIPIPLLSEIVAVLVNVSTQYLTLIAQIFASLPPRPIASGAWTLWMTVGYYTIFGFLAFSWPWATNLAERVLVTRFTEVNRPDFVKFVPSFGPLGVAAVLLVVGAFTWGATLAQPSSKPYLSVRFFETSHGESILVETPNGNRMLIDGGGKKTEIADTLTRLIPVSDRNIQIVMPTHADADHVGGLPEVLQRFQTDAVIHSGLLSSSDVFSSWFDVMEKHANAITVHPGMKIALDHGVYLEVISSGCLDISQPCTQKNNTSIVSRLQFGAVSFLFTGDIEKTAEAILVAKHPQLHTTVLKAPHHGSITSSTEVLLNAVKPAAIVVAVGSENRYGHPHPDVMSRFNRLVGEERVFRTDLLGTLEFRTDGERLWMVR